MTTKAFAFATVVCAAAAGLAGLGACASDDDPAATVISEAGPDRVVAAPHAFEKVPDAAPVLPPVLPPPDAAAFDAGPCNARIDAIPIVESPHVPEGTLVTYGSNPPSSGPHYDQWANFQEFTHPVDDRNLVHSLEHGALLLLYRCEAEGPDCDALAAALRAVRGAVPTDPLCDAAIRHRVILAPRAANDVPVAAAAWGYTYRADCVDPASLSSFILDHYAKGPENFCAAGQIF